MKKCFKYLYFWENWNSVDLIKNISFTDQVGKVKKISWNPGKKISNSERLIDFDFLLV